MVNHVDRSCNEGRELMVKRSGETLYLFFYMFFVTYVNYNGRAYHGQQCVHMVGREMS